MVMIHFKMDEHTQRGKVNMVEVWDDGIFLAAIYPGIEGSIKIISKYSAEVHQADDTITVEFAGGSFVLPPHS